MPQGRIRFCHGASLRVHRSVSRAPVLVYRQSGSHNFNGLREDFQATATHAGQATDAQQFANGLMCTLYMSC